VVHPQLHCFAESKKGKGWSYSPGFKWEKLLSRSYELYLFSIYTCYSDYLTSLYVFKRFYCKTSKEEKYSNKYKKEYELTNEQKESLIGLILADAFLERVKPNHNTRLRIDHTFPAQEAYVLSLYALFSPLIAMEPVISVRKPDQRTGKVYKSMYFRTLNFSCLNKYHDLFYKNKTKVVPLNIHELLTPRGLAHWIMGDGFLYDKAVVVLCTESFTKKELEVLIAALDKKFGIQATLNKRISTTGTVGWRIRVRKKSMDKLTTLVSPFFIPELLYKLGIDQ